MTQDLTFIFPIHSEDTTPPIPGHLKRVRKIEEKVTGKVSRTKVYFGHLLPSSDTDLSDESQNDGSLG